ncbi:MAG: dTDP-4-dehydrorhamnose reductase [Parvularculaceae bacterium]
MRMLVFGRNGQVAQALADLGGDSVTALGRAEADLMQPGAAAKAIDAHAPEIVVNAAAYTAVDKAESEGAAARRLNTDAPAEMAAAAKARNIPFIHLSTDYVFDGAADRKFSEDAPTGPLNIYGATKLDGEHAVMAAHPGAVVIRTSWVFSEYGANFVKTMLRLGRERGALSVVADQIGGPTAAADIASATIAIAGKKHRGAPGEGIYHFQGAPAVSWAGFAEAIFTAAGMTVPVTPIETKDYSTPARRPLHTILDCAKIERDFGLSQPDWRIDLARVIAKLNPREQTS